MVARLVSIGIIGTVICGAIGVSTVHSVVSKIEKTLPDVSHLTAPNINAPSVIIDADGNTEGTFGTESSGYIASDAIPDVVRHAFVSAEDQTFYTHDGIDWLGVVRAARNGMNGNVQGGSTITQQVIKNMVTGNERSMGRKIREALLARRLEKYQTKDEILGLYLNTIWLGAGAYGIASASQAWFQKPVYELSTPEAAFLAALAKGPAIIDPQNHPDRAIARRHYVLDRMCHDGYVSCEMIPQWDRTPLPHPHSIAVSGTADDWYEETVRRKLVADYGTALYSGGMKVHEYRNASLQKFAQTELVSGIDSYMSRHPRMKERPSGAVIIMDSDTGHVLAEVGGEKYSGGYDRAMQSTRQIGSIAKTIETMEALQSGYHSDTDVMDVPVHIETSPDVIWSPGADGGDGMGIISLTKALSESRNQAFVRIANDMGFQNVFDAYIRYGLYPSTQKLVPSSILGAVETTPIAVATAYSRIVSGKDVSPEFIRKIDFADGHDIEFHDSSDEMQTPEQTREIRSMLYQVTAHGTAYSPFSGMNLDDVGGKTGTSNNVMDSWFSGYYRNITIVVHIGFDHMKSLGEHEFGSTVAAPIAASIIRDMEKTPN